VNDFDVEAELRLKEELGRQDQERKEAEMREKFKFDLEADPIKRLQLIDSGVRDREKKQNFNFMSPPLLDYRSVDRKLNKILERTIQTKKGSL